MANVILPARECGCPFGSLKNDDIRSRSPQLLNQPDDANGDQQHSTGLGPKRLLLVEDDRFVQRVISLMAKKLGCSIVLADSVASGWREAQKARFDLILLDWNLPDGTGGEVIRRIRTYPYYSRNQRTPIVVQSASPDAVRLDLSWIYYPTVIHPGKITGIETLRQILRRWSA